MDIQHGEHIACYFVILLVVIPFADLVFYFVSERSQFREARLRLHDFQIGCNALPVRPLKGDAPAEGEEKRRL
jgi:hypothetical protein